MSKVMVSKETGLCPFSRKMCRECAIYRGRHFELCSLRNPHLNEIRAAKLKAWNEQMFTKWEMPEIPTVKGIVVDVENIVETRDV